MSILAVDEAIDIQRTEVDIGMQVDIGVHIFTLGQYIASAHCLLVLAGSSGDGDFRTGRQPFTYSDMGRAGEVNTWTVVDRI